MDLNLCVIAGRLAAKPEIRVFEGGATLVRYLVTTRTGAAHDHEFVDGACTHVDPDGTVCDISEAEAKQEPRRRIDVVPAVMWDAKEEDSDFERGDRIWIAGSVQRRFWSDDHSRRSRIEVVANHVQKGIDPSVFGDDRVVAGLIHETEESERIAEQEHDEAVMNTCQD